MPVIVARPRVPLPKLGVTLTSNIASTIRAVLNRKILFIAARPPGKTSREFASGAQERNRLIDVTFVGFPSLRPSDAFALNGMPDAANPILSAWARGTCTRLNAVILSHARDLCQAGLPPGMIKKCAFAAESWLLIGDSLAVFGAGHRSDCNWALTHQVCPT